MKRNDSEPLVLAHSFDYDWQAHIAKSLLEEHGIRSIIDNEMMGTILPLGFNSIGGFRLMVFRSDLEEARRLIADMRLD